MKYVILGLSNVGKSSIFNYLCGEKVSIVYDQRNTTVDYISYNFENNVTLTDTCGMHNVKSIMFLFSENYYKFSNVVIYVIDCRRDDLEINRHIINKIISDKQLWLVCNFFFEGFDVKLPYNKVFYIGNDFHGAAILKNEISLAKQRQQSNLAVFVGASNVGKSSLFNCLVGFARSKTKDEIGTTRDSVKEIVNEYSDLVFVDTAGFVNDDEGLAKITEDERMKMIKKSYCLFIVIDGSFGLSNTDKYILNLANKYGVFSILIVNKVDIARPDLDRRLEEFNITCPIVYTSAINNNLNDFHSVFKKLYEKSKKTIRYYINLGYIRELNKILKTIEVMDVKGKKFILDSIKLKSTNPFIFIYDSRLRLCDNSLKRIKNQIRNYLKLHGFNIQFIHRDDYVCINDNESSYFR